MTPQAIAALLMRELALDLPLDAPLAYGQIPEWTSASHMAVILALEEELGVEFTADEIIVMTSVEAIAHVVARAAP